MKKTHRFFDRRLLAALVTLLIEFYAVPGWAKIYLDINAPTIRPLPLAILVF